ncbi:MAG: lipocalin [Bacteroidetes bacterium]|nr:lipocalin [Bacteroidota bacterium]
MRIMLLLVGAVLISCMKNSNKYTVNNLDIKRYAGTWYEIARFPHRFERDLQKVTATYTLLEKGGIKVTNRGQNPKGNWKEVNGKAFVPYTSQSGKLKVQFFWPFRAPYWVHRIDPEYRYALVGGPGNDYLWVLCREKSMPEEMYQDYLKTARELGYDIARLEKVQQE